MGWLACGAWRRMDAITAVYKLKLKPHENSSVSDARMIHGQNRDLCMYLSVSPVWISTCMHSTTCVWISVTEPPRSHKKIPAQQHTLRLENTHIPTPSCSGLPIPLARLELWRPFARRPGWRARRPTHAQGDLAPRPLLPYT